MARARRAAYAERALAQLPRILGNQDRNPFSPTFGCFHRDYWLDKTSDFPDAVRQFAAQALALVYKHEFPQNPYFANPNVRDWAIAGIDYWSRIQHSDGSFDEFYPYERGWVGPTAFTTFTAVETVQLLRGEIPPDIEQRVRAAIHRAASFIVAGESEEDHLANHHAMAFLAVWKANRLLEDPKLEEGLKRVWKVFLTYHDNEEGWSREYDGIDPGYLSATVSFLAKVYQDNKDPEILEVLRRSVETCSYFAYPDGFYAGSLGSRNTLHFYPHGFEIVAAEAPLAAATAEHMLAALDDGKLVPPEIMSDRYLVYRVPEFLQSYLDYSERPQDLPPLPFQRGNFSKYFPKAKVSVVNHEHTYTVTNLAKGGVVRHFDRITGELRLHDCGIIGTLRDGRVVSSQWIDSGYACRGDDRECEVSGTLQIVPSHKVFTLFKNLLFRSALFLMGWNERLCHFLKGQIRKSLILGQRPVPIGFRRTVRIDADELIVHDDITLREGTKLGSLQLGGDFAVRHVPQSRYFQRFELRTDSRPLSNTELDRLNETGSLSARRTVSSRGTSMELTFGSAASG